MAGWREAIHWFDENPDAAAAMGRRARALVDAGLNADTFAKRLADIFDRILART